MNAAGSKLYRKNPGKSFKNEGEKKRIEKIAKITIIQRTQQTKVTKI